MQALKELKVRISFSEETKSFTIKNPEALSPRSQTPSLANESLSQATENLETQVEEAISVNNDQSFVWSEACIETIVESMDDCENKDLSLNEELVCIDEMKHSLSEMEQKHIENKTDAKQVELEQMKSIGLVVQEPDLEFETNKVLNGSEETSSEELNEETQDLSFEECILTVTDNLEANYVSLESLPDESLENNKGSFCLKLFW